MGGTYNFFTFCQNTSKDQIEGPENSKVKYKYFYIPVWPISERPFPKTLSSTTSKWFIACLTLKVFTHCRNEMPGTNLISIYKVSKYINILSAFPTRTLQEVTYLHNKCPQNNRTEDSIVKDAFKNVSFTMNFSGINFIKKLHHHKCIKYNSIMLWRRSMQRCISSTIDIENFLTCVQKAFISSLNGVFTHALQ